MLKTDEMIINMGPQHPSTHGVLRLILHLDGEIVKKLDCDIGYLHRGMEKLAERQSYLQYLPFTDRWDYLASMLNNQVYVMAIEKLMDVEVPPRAEYIRVMMAELNRIASHLLWLGSFAIDLGAMTVFLYTFRERDTILELFNAVCGSRMTYAYFRPGGVREDLPEGFVEKVRRFRDIMPARIDEYDGLLSENEIFLARTKNIGVISPEMAINYGLSGACLRGSGVNYDVRKAEPYSVYRELEFTVPLGQTGDSFDRYYVRLEEMRQSVKILQQVCERLPEGEVMAKIPKALKPPAGEAYVHVESARGDLGIYLVSDGSERPYRLHVRPPSFINLSALDHMLRGHTVSDVMAVLGSIDIVLGEVDR